MRLKTITLLRVLLMFAVLTAATPLQTTGAVKDFLLQFPPSLFERTFDGQNGLYGIPRMVSENITDGFILGWENNQPLVSHEIPAFSFNPFDGAKQRGYFNRHGQRIAHAPWILGYTYFTHFRLWDLNNGGIPDITLYFEGHFQRIFNGMGTPGRMYRYNGGTFWCVVGDGYVTYTSLYFLWQFSTIIDPYSPLNFIHVDFVTYVEGQRTWVDNFQPIGSGGTRVRPLASYFVSINDGNGWSNYRDGMPFLALYAPWRGDIPAIVEATLGYTLTPVFPVNTLQFEVLTAVQQLAKDISEPTPRKRTQAGYPLYYINNPARFSPEPCTVAAFHNADSLDADIVVAALGWRNSTWTQVRLQNVTTRQGEIIEYAMGYIMTSLLTPLYENITYVAYTPVTTPQPTPAATPDIPDIPDAPDIQDDNTENSTPRYIITAATAVLVLAAAAGVVVINRKKNHPKKSGGFCKSCGSPKKAGSRFCYKCGAGIQG